METGGISEAWWCKHCPLLLTLRVRRGANMYGSKRVDVLAC